MQFQARFCAAFQSINVPIHRAADLSRVTVLELLTSESVDREEAQKNAEHFQDLSECAHALFSSDFASRFVARSLKLAPTILANAKTFSMILGECLGSKRHGDQI